MFCTEYCGTSHSDMLAKVHVRTEKEYEAGSRSTATIPTPRRPTGKKMFNGKGGCVACHAVAADQAMPNIGPKLWQAFGRVEKLADGSQVTMDENYVRESIEYPNKQTVAGFAAGAMPTFKGVLSDRDQRPYRLHQEFEVTEAGNDPVQSLHLPRPAAPVAVLLQGCLRVASVLAFTLDHKRIGIMYFWCSCWRRSWLGGVFALLVRTELLTPGKTIVDANTYNRLVHAARRGDGVLVIIPRSQRRLGNLILPLQLGAKDVAFPV